MKNHFFFYVKMITFLYVSDMDTKMRYFNEEVPNKIFKNISLFSVEKTKMKIGLSDLCI